MDQKLAVGILKVFQEKLLSGGFHLEKPKVEGSYIISIVVVETQI